MTDEAPLSLVTCHTDGCSSQDKPVELALTWFDQITGEAHTVGSVLCGACCEPITDIQPTTSPEAL